MPGRKEVIGKDPKNNDIHVQLNDDVKILHVDNLIVFLNVNPKDGNGKVFLRIENTKNLDALANGILRSRDFLARREAKKKKEQYVSFSGQTRFQLQKPQ